MSENINNVFTKLKSPQTENDSEFTKPNCSPQSPDFSSIEHLWDVLEWEITTNKSAGTA